MTEESKSKQRITNSEQYFCHRTLNAKHLNPEPGTLNLEPGTLNLEPKTFH
jgi:hypothetical protein